MPSPHQHILQVLTNQPPDPRQRHQRRHNRRLHPNPPPQMPALLLDRPPTPPQTRRQETPPGPRPHQAPPRQHLRVLVQQRLLDVPEQALLVSRRERLPRQAEERARGRESGERRAVEGCGRGGHADCCCAGGCCADLDWEEFLLLYCDLMLGWLEVAILGG